MKKITIAILLNLWVAAPAIASDFYAGAKFGSVLYAYPRSPSDSGVSGGYNNGTMANDMQTGYADYWRAMKSAGILQRRLNTTIWAI